MSAVSDQTGEKKVICGETKLMPLAFLPGMVVVKGDMTGKRYAGLVCVRKPGHPEPDLDPSLHACGDQRWVATPPGQAAGGDDRG